MSWFRSNQVNKKSSRAIETTVTYLEMLKPTIVTAKRPVNINTALLATQNIPLHFYRYLYFQVGQNWHWEMRLRMNDDELSKNIHNHAVNITVLYVDGAPAGFFEVNSSSKTTTDLAYFGIMPHIMGKGLGRWFLSTAIEQCWSSKPDKITVNTCTLDHPAALSLYQKMGFKAYRQASGHVHPLSDTERANLAKTDIIIK